MNLPPRVARGLFRGLVVFAVLLWTGVLVGRFRGEAAAPPPLELPMSSGHDRNGFVFDKVLWAATSRDLADWTGSTALLKGCDTPQLGWVGDRLFVYYVWAHGLARTEILAAGRTCPALGESTGFRIEGDFSPGITDPALVRLGPDSYRLYYVSPAEEDVARAEPGRNLTEVRSAHSRDGVNWEREKGFRHRGHGLVDPEAVLLPDGRYRLYYSGGSDGFIYSALSVDGLVFQPEPGARVEGAVSSTVPVPGEGWLMVHQRWPERGRLAVLSAARSEDGRAFRPDPGFRAPAPPAGRTLESPSLTRLPDGTWLLVYLEVRMPGAPAATAPSSPPARSGRGVRESG